jgi:DNA-binding winged helix-turn-helix (wHTH) protein
MPAGSGFGFGPFQLDPRSKRLLRENAEVRLTARQFDLLHALVQHPGELLAKDRLIQAAWPDVAVTDNSLAQAISALRATLDPDHPDGYIHTQPRRGYRFVAPVARIGTRQSDSVFDDLLAPHRGLLEGRAALETLQSDEIARARTTFEQLVAGDSSEAAFHVGLANACVLQFEATRAYTVPEVEALRAAEAHAREACRLNADHGEAWATLGFVLERTGHRVDALAALRRATIRWPRQNASSTPVWPKCAARPVRITGFPQWRCTGSRACSASRAATKTRRSWRWSASCRWSRAIIFMRVNAARIRGTRSGPVI